MFERFTERGWHNSVGSSSDGQVIWLARLSSNSKNWENPLFYNNNNNNNIFFLLKHVCETINNKKKKRALLSWQLKKKEYRERRSDDELMSLKSGTLIFVTYEGCSEYFSGSLEFLLGPFFLPSLRIRLIIPFFYRPISGLKMVSDWLANKRQLGVIFPLVSQS